MIKSRKSTEGSRGVEAVADEAAEWLATLPDNSCADQERQAFMTWLRSSNLHVEEFLRISALTHQIARSDRWAAHTVEELVASAKSSPDSVTRLSTFEARRTRAIEAFRPQRRWALAACAMSLIAVFTLAALKPELIAWGPKTYTTAVGELRSVTLADGSIIELNTRSSVRVRLNDRERTVQLLHGEAIFKVAKNPQRPFRVAVGSTQVVALGTAFNIYAHETQTIVTVLEGRVRVTDEASQVIPGSMQQTRDLQLDHGEQVIVRPRLPLARVTLQKPEKVISWTERRLVFEDTPLAAVAYELARYSDRTIRIEDTGIAARRVTGVFEATDPASFVQFLKTQENIAVREDVRGWVVTAI